jgi:flavin reductase (DIM6/NTAB) family NADH-FMN oxidoreductase RutF
MSGTQAAKAKTYWQTALELPEEVFAVWRKPDRTLNPAAIVATLDPDGTPHTAPFGSLRAITPRLLRLGTWRGHNTYATLCRDARVAVTMIAPPDIAVSIRGHARVVREQMSADEHYAIIEVDIKEVKNDVTGALVIESAIAVSVRDEHRDWFQAVLGEIEKL